MIKSLHSFRFFFAIMIFLHHSALNIPCLGSFPVSFFLILSGYVIMMSYGNEVSSMSYKTFILKRWIRIYPTYLLCLIIALITRVYVSLPINWDNTIPSFFLIQAWIPNKEVYFAGNSVGWYVSVVVFCYAMFPFISRVIKKHATSVVTISIVYYITFIMILPTSLSHAFLYINPLFRMVDFILGMWLCVVINKDSSIRGVVHRMNNREKLLLEGGVLAVTVFFIVISLKIDNPLSLAALWWLPSILLIAIFSLLDDCPGPLTKVLHNPILVSLGSITYAFYLLHISLLWINNKIMDYYTINYVLDGIIVLTIILALSYFITYKFEPLFKSYKI